MEVSVPLGPVAVNSVLNKHTETSINDKLFGLLLRLVTNELLYLN